MGSGFKLAVVFSALLLGACASAPGRVFVTEEVTWPSYRAEIDNCYAQVRGDVPIEERNMDIPMGTGTTRTVMVPSGGGLAVAGGVGFAAGFARGYARAKAESEWVAHCMEIKRFVEVGLEPDERTRLGEISDDAARTAFLREISDRQNLPARRAQADAAREQAAKDALRRLEETKEYEAETRKQQFGN